jgi:hypothetical protein
MSLENELFPRLRRFILAKVLRGGGGCRELAAGSR